MAWIPTIAPAEADGLLARIYANAKKRAGRVFQILRIMSLRPRQLEASMGLYGEIMHGRSGLSRRERELVATVVSAENHCGY